MTQNAPDEAALLRRFLTDCTRQLRDGTVPAADIGALSPASAAIAAEFLRVAGGIKSKNLSLMHGLDVLRNGFGIFDTDHQLVYANSTFRDFFQQKVWVGPGVHLHMLIDTIERHDMIQISDGQIGDWVGRALSGDVQPLIVRLASGGVFRWIMRRGPVGNIVMIASDITRETARQTELEQLMAEASRASEAKSTFLAHMSHELRTPMNGVIGMAEMLCDSGLDPERQRYAETIRNSAEALLTIINDVLDFTRGRGESVRISEAAFDLEGVAVEVATLLQPAARAKGLDLRVLYDPLTARRWIGDVGRVRQVIVNLVGNAVKYTHSGFVRLIVIAGEDGPQVLIHDSGPGIPDERVDAIFEEFGQLAEPGVTGISGSGLGLAITAQLVRVMGGILWLDSHVGVGSTFGVTLPLRQAGGGTDRAQMPAVPLGAGSVLAVLDNRTLARHLRRLVAGTGLRLIVCTDTESMIDALDAGLQPGLVLFACSDDGDLMARRLGLLRGRAPGTAAWLLITASQHCPAAPNFDRLLTLPIARETLLAPIIDHLSGVASTPADVPDPRPPEHPGLRRMRVLVADDNATNRLVIEKMLRHCPIDLMTAENGQQAVETWRRDAPDLILMDVSMPVMNGREATQAIRAAERDAAMARTRIVAVTAAIGETDRAEVLAAGMDEVMTKPVRRAVLLAQIVLSAPPDVLPPVPPEGDRSDAA